MMLRPYTVADLDEVLDVWHRASLIAHPFLSEEFLDAERRQISDQWLPVAETTVCDSGGRVVGFVSLVGNEVGGLFVDPDRQGQGIGRALMDHACGSRPFLELDVLEANHSGRRFYAAYGFVEMGRHADDDSGHPAIRLRIEMRGPCAAGR